MRRANIRDILDRAHAYAREYIDGIEDQRVFPSPDALAALDGFDEPMPAEPSSGLDLLDTLHRLGSPATVAQTGGRYFGFVNGGLLPEALGAKWLADAWDQNLAMFVMSPVVSRIEEVCERWMVELLDLPEGTAAGFVPGTTLSLLSGMAAARNELLRRQGWDLAAKGLWNAPPLRVVLGEEAHAAVFKSLALLGIGRNSIEVVPADSQGRLDVDQMPALDARTLVVAQAGNVSSGAFDNTGLICELARPAGAWVHVDGAFGLWAAGARSTRHLYEGTQHADSWSVDAHKTLNAPYDSGIILCRDRGALHRAFEADGAYFQWSDRRDGMRTTPSMSRRARAVELWATLKALGRSGVDDLVDRLCRLARRFATRLENAGFEIHNDIVFNQVLVSYGDDELTRAIVARIQESGECWCGGSVWKGRAVIRISVCSWATTEDDVDRSVAVFERAREQAELATVG